MTTYIKTLKEDNGDIVYPQTITDAIYTSGGQTLETEISKYVTAEDIASSVASFGTVTGSMIDNNTITSSNLNLASVIDLFYPVGSYYETSDTTFDPNVSWTGTWVEDTDGRILVAKDSGTFATVGDTGGAERHTHTVDARIRVWFGAVVGETSRTIDIVDENGTRGTMTQGTGNMPTGTTNRNAALSGSVTAFNHDGFGQKVLGKTYSDSSLQPYVVIKRWHRTA